MFKNLKQQRQWREKNFEHYKSYSKKWREQNSNYKKQWRKNHPGYSLMVSRKTFQKNKIILHELKLNGCAICGYGKCDKALQFHHVNPKNKKFNITSTQISNKNLVAELCKCILLCANCHLEIHALQNPP